MKVLGVTPAHTPLYAYILLAAIGTFSHVLQMQQFELEKASIPTSKEERIEFARKLSKYNISLTQYEHILARAEIKP